MRQLHADIVDQVLDREYTKAVMENRFDVADTILAISKELLDEPDNYNQL